MKYKTGMYAGSFNPLHMGHCQCIRAGAAQCEELNVILFYSMDKNEIAREYRYRWISNWLGNNNIKNVRLHTIYDDISDKNSHDWIAGARAIKKAVSKKIDAVYCGSDYDKGFESLYPESEVIRINREAIPVSSTDIRENPFKHWGYLPEEVRPHYVKRVMITGTESCGKSTMAKMLAEHFNTSYVKEYGRDVCDSAGGINNMIPEDFIEILHRHKAAEYDLIKKSNKLLFFDTDCIVTRYYHDLLFPGAKTPAVYSLADIISRDNSFDLVLYLNCDVEWVQDGTRTYGEQSIREENSRRLINMYNEKKIDLKFISGNYEERFRQAAEYCSALLE